MEMKYIQIIYFSLQSTGTSAFQSEAVLESSEFRPVIPSKPLVITHLYLSVGKYFGTL